MRDCEPALYAAAVAAMEDHARALADYQGATLAQREAANADDYDRVEQLTVVVDAILARLADAGHRLEPAVRDTRTGRSDGPRSRELRRMLQALESNAERAHRAVHQLVEELMARRDQTAGELDRLDLGMRVEAAYAPRGERERLDFEV